MNIVSILDLYKAPIPLSVDGTELDVTSSLVAVTTANPVGYVNGSYPSDNINLSETLVVEITSNTDIHFRIDVAPVATTNDPVILIRQIKKIICKNNQKVSVIKMDGAPNGKVWITALRKG